MVVEERSPNPIYIAPDLVEEILLRLPLESIIEFKTVSKQWRSILESKSFVERRKNVQKKQKILAAFNCRCGERPSLCPESRFQGDEEIVYLHCDANAERPSMTCDGLVCIPQAGWVDVFNPSTRQLRRLPSGPVPEPSSFFIKRSFLRGMAMGFGRDKVTGSYKVVRMWYDPSEECELLDVETGEWRKLRPPPYKMDVERKSVCVNGTIYWLRIWWDYKILALNLHTEEFHDVSFPVMWATWNTQLMSLEDRLAIAKTKRPGTEWKLVILTMDAEEETWSETYSISLAAITINPWESTWFTPVTVSKLGNVVFFDNHNRLFKYYSETGNLILLSKNVCVISPYIENLVRLGSESGHDPDYEIRTSRCRLFPKHQTGSVISKFLKRNGFGIPEIVFTTLVILDFYWKPL